MYAWEAVQQSIEWIESNLSEEITIECLAETAALSPFYFQRLFKRMVNKPVFEYIRLRRLARASEKLPDLQSRILDIALAYGFQSHEHFTRSFKAAYGLTPEEYRKKPVMLNHFKKPDLFLNFVSVNENVPLISDGIILEISREEIQSPVLAAGFKCEIPIASQIPVGKTTGLNTPGILWEKFHKEKEKIPHILADGFELGASLLGEKEGYFTYFAGAAVGRKAEGHENWVLPAGKYIACYVESENKADLLTAAIDKALNYLLKVWLPNHNLTIAPFSAEKYHLYNTDHVALEILVKLLP